MNWKEKLRNWFVPKDPVQWIILAALLLLLAYQGRKSWLDNADIQQHAMETPGVLVDYYKWGKSNIANVFEYEVDGHSHRTESGHRRFKGCLQTRSCIGERYMIQYSPVHPSKANVLWDKHLPRIDASGVNN